MLEQLPHDGYETIAGVGNPATVDYFPVRFGPGGTQVELEPGSKGSLCRVGSSLYGWATETEDPERVRSLRDSERLWAEAGQAFLGRLEASARWVEDEEGAQTAEGDVGVIQIDWGGRDAQSEHQLAHHERREDNDHGCKVKENDAPPAASRLDWARWCPSRFGPAPARRFGFLFADGATIRPDAYIFYAETNKLGENFHR